MKYTGLMLIISLFAVIACGCSPFENTEYSEASRLIEAMDTVMSIKAYGDKAEEVLDKSEAEIMRLDAMLRRKSADSEIYRLNSGNLTDISDISDETSGLIKRALDICEKTDGAFDITIAPVMDLWGFYDSRFYVPSDAELNETLSLVDYKNVDKNTISIKNNASIDLGGIAKGYTSDRIAGIFRENNITSGIVSLGGNVQAIGTKPDGSNWRVAVQSPNDESYIGVLEISDAAVITSGGYQRFFEQDGVIYHHIIDPSTGCPADSGLISVSVISKDGTLADGLSTALFVMGLDKGTEYWKSHNDFDAVFMTDDNRIYITEGIRDIFESEYDYSVISK